MRAARRRWPTHVRERLPLVEALYAELRAAPVTTFLHRAWEASVLVAAARAYLDTVGRTTTTKKVARLSIPEGALHMVAGPLHVTASVWNRGTLIVGGDLVVGGDIEDDYVGRMTVVEGDLRCRVLAVSGGVIVGGSLAAERLVSGAHPEDGIEVRGRVSSPVTLLDGKPLRARRVATLLIEPSLPFGELRALARKLAPRFVSDALAEDQDGDDEEEVEVGDYIDLAGIERAARAGESVTKPRRGT